MLNILNTAQSGLSTSQIQVENVMNNLANQNTEGYKTRTVNVTEMEQSDSRLTGRGVSVEDVTRSTNIYMYQNLIQAESNLSYTTQLDSMLGDIESIFGETDSAGFSADLTNYLDALENLKTSPQNEVYKNDVSNNAEVIVSNLQALYSGIEDREETTLLNVKENVGEINSILNQIGTISQEILENTTGTTNALLDQRDLLEKELSEYIDVEISRDDSYELKIAGITAVRFDTNVHNVVLIEEYTPQKDVYAAVDDEGRTITDPEIKDSIIPSTWDDSGIAEIQEIDISGTYDDESGDAALTAKTIQFLGTSVPTQMGATATEMRDDILADSTNIITNWNKENPDKEIASITVGTGDQVLITYTALAGDVPAIDNEDEDGIAFTGSIETTKGEVDSFTYTLNNEYSETVTYGEDIYEADGVTLADINGDGDNTNDTVTEDNALQAMIYKINNSEDMGSTIHAYNGQYELADDGSKILTSDPRHSLYDESDPYKDRYIVIEAQVEGEKGSFVGEFLVNDSNEKNHQEINELMSNEGLNDIHLEIYEEEVTFEGGSLKAMIDNLKTDSGANVYNEYKEKLDQFAKSLADITGSYIENADLSYVYGSNTVELSTDEDKKVELNLFTGADVKSLQFNALSLNTLTQDNLDYLSTIQWKEDIDFDGTGDNLHSFSDFYQTLRISIADNKENASFLQESQSSVAESLGNTYDAVTKVDSDAQMIELIKYQSAYEANAKMITAVDEMLQTLLAM